MNERSIPPATLPQGPNNWLDAYLPAGPVVESGGSSQLINMALVRGILFRQRWLIAGVLALALTAGLVVTLLTTPLYEATAKVRVSPYGANILSGQNIEQSLAPNQVTNFLATQVEIIQSRGLAETIAKDLKLGTRYDLIGKDVDESRPPNMTDAQWLENKNLMAASVLAGSISADVPDSAWVIPIRFRFSNPVVAAEMANIYADYYVAYDTRNSTSNNQYAQEYLMEQISDVRQKLAEAEQAANLYARNSGIFVQPGGMTADGPSAPSTLTTTNLVGINERLAAARAARIDAEQKWRAVQGVPASQLVEAQASPVLQALLTERTAKRTQLEELRQRYTDDFPQIATLLAQIQVLDSQIARTGDDIKSTLRSAYIIAQNQENALQAEFQSIAGDKLVEQDRQVEFGALEREAQSLRSQLAVLLQRYNELRSAANVETGAIAKLDAAVVPAAPVSPNLFKNIGLALALGIAAAAGLAVLRETLDDRIRSLEDIEDKIGQPLLGGTPFVEDRDISSVGNNRFSALMEAYSSIRASIDFTLPRNRNVIMMTSSQASEGKSTTAVILAELFASMGRRTLLIDADLRRPSVARLLDIERPKVGLVEVLLGHVELSQAIVRGVHENLEILPIGEIPPNPTEILASNELQQFIEKHREEYGLIIFDSCPLLGLADAALLSRLVDGTVFVLEANKVPFAQVRSGIRRLKSAGGNLLGVVLTKYRALEAGQNYNYQYGYYQHGDDK